MARGVTRHLRQLPRLKCLTASKTSTVLDYPRNFGNAAKDGLKRTTRWVVYYFTNSNSWYPTPGRAMILPAITAIHPLPPLQPDFEEQQENNGKQEEKEDGQLVYDSPCDDGDNPSLEQETDFHLGRLKSAS
ncbi:hypothetical protein pdam_00019251 [Pocillopora damicornis]|uniref:Uncharacterized protein n=1 Tax=Pocillopora damicornis TaxID=46731 RepID=A0A3M6TCH6_POCDA|nr:hypothetical protein pdam_00019251 [Pocillopora damicornis]